MKTPLTIGFALWALVGTFSLSSAKTVSLKLPNLASYYTAKAKGRTVEIREVHFGGDYLAGPLHYLADATQKYPKADQLKISWTVTVASSSSQLKALYLRSKHILYLDGYQYGGLKSSKVHCVYTNVTDQVILTTAQATYGKAASLDGAFFCLPLYGAKFQTPRSKPKTVRRL